MMIDGREVGGYRSPDTPALWIRDHSDILRAGRYFHDDVRSAVDCFANVQAGNGRLYDYVTTFPEKKPCERENWEKWVRVPVESDVEYRFVKAAFLAWQSTGDADWISRLIPACERALTYTMTHPWRWDETHGLVKRPYTIDTWDFDYTAGRHPWLNFAVTDHTFWGIAHGDNSGFYESARLLAHLCAATGDSARASSWMRHAEGVRQRANALLFNGRYYRHFHKLTPATIEGVDEEAQLSLSNPMAINRGLASHEAAVAILSEYRARGEREDAFEPWFAIDPPFPDGVFGDEKLVGGAYVNGGVFPLVGGELARAALEHGREVWGLEILDRYAGMIAEKGETYLWYFRDGTPSSEETSTSPEATPTDGWGSSAMLYALLEGLFGIVDLDHSFRHVRCAPRWAAGDEREATAEIAYAASGAFFGYHYDGRTEGELQIELRAKEARVDLHALLPAGRRANRVTWNGREIPFENLMIESSPYVDCSGLVDGNADLRIDHAGN